MYTSAVPSKPAPASKEDRDRVAHSGLRHRMLTGGWQPDLSAELSQFYAAETLSRMTHPDLSRCVFKSVQVALNVCFDESPTVAVLESDKQPDLSAIVTPRLWPIRQSGHLITLGLNESLMRLDWDADRYRDLGYGIDYRAVWPDHVVATSHPDRPDVPHRIEELRLRHPSPDVCEWTWETWDVSNPDAPVFRIEVEDDDGDRIDVTSRYYDGTKGYPYRDRAGKPILPYVLFHREISNRLWSYLDGFELVEGTLKAACLYTMWLYGYRDCASPQRVGVDIMLPAARNLGPNNAEVDRITLDQGAILMAISKGDPGSGRIDTLPATMIPGAALEAIGAYVQGLLQDAGLGAADTSDEGLSRVSGYAIVVSREALRKSQRRQIPACRVGDQLLLATAARMVNAYEGADLPEQPGRYSLSYHGIPKALEEIRTDVEKIQALRNVQPSPLISLVDAMLLLHPHMTAEQAQVKLDEIDAEMSDRALLIAAPVEADTAPAISDPSEGATASAGRAMAAPGDMAEAVEVNAPAEPEPGQPPPAATGGQSASDTALNGAQVTSLLDVVERVATRKLPRESAIAILVRAFSVRSEDAESMLGEVGKTFFVDAPAAPSFPFRPPPSPTPDEPDKPDEAAPTE